MSWTLWSYCLIAIFINSVELKHEGYRQVYFEDLLDNPEWSRGYKRFDVQQLGTISHFVIHSKTNSLFVAVNNSVIRLRLDTFTEVDRVTWSLSTEQLEECKRISSDETKRSIFCSQYAVSLLYQVEDVLPPDTGGTLRPGLVICLTNHISSECSIRQLLDLRAPPMIYWKGAQQCPFSSTVPVTATWTSDRSLFIGGKFDEDPSSTAAILRLTLDAMQSSSASEIQFPPRTAARLNWIVQNERSIFVDSFEFHKAVYFIFREAANEAIENCRKEVIVSRIGRVCLHDRGLKTGRLHSFLKATLICPGSSGSRKEEVWRLHNMVQSVHVDQNSKRFFAAFTTPKRAFPSSAVCEYSFDEIEAVFNGPFYDIRGIPTKFNNHIQCDIYPLHTTGSVHQLIDQHLMYKTVHPVRNLPVMVHQGRMWTSLTVDWAPISPKADDNLILFTMSNQGVLYKWHHFKSTTCLLEQIDLHQPFHRKWSLNRPHLIKLNRATLQSTQGKSLSLPDVVISTGSSILRLPVARCDRLGHYQSACELMNDPYCVWNGKKKVCEEVDPNIRQLHNTDLFITFDSCPTAQKVNAADFTMDGNWGAWSPWTPCNDIDQNQFLSAETSHLSVSKCQCRYRRCSAPFANGKGGQPCANGSAIQLKNCNVDGGWTQWTPWSGCEPQCGLDAFPVEATQTKQRWCSNPSPQGAGRKCEGLGKVSQTCPHEIPKCSEKVVSPPSWSLWSPWSTCSADCGSGQQIRWRKCRLPKNNLQPPALQFNDNKDSIKRDFNSSACLGNAYDVQTCHKKCPVTKVTSAWTSWYVAEGNQQTGTKQHRFRVECIDNVADAEQLLATAKFEQSVCSIDAHGRSVCQPSTDETDLKQWEAPADEHTWSTWTKCSRACGLGKTYRWRKRKLSSGHPDLENGAVDREGDICNAHACPATVNNDPVPSPWTEWSPCFSVRHWPYEVRIRIREHCEGCDVREVKRCDTDDLVQATPVQNIDDYLRVKRHTLVQVVLVGIVASLLGVSVVILPYLCYPACKRNKTQPDKSKSNKSIWHRLLPVRSSNRNNLPYIWFAESDNSANSVLQSPTKHGQINLNTNEFMSVSEKANAGQLSGHQQHPSLTGIQALHNDHMRRTMQQPDTTMTHKNRTAAVTWNQTAGNPSEVPQFIPANVGSYKHETVPLIRRHEGAATQSKYKRRGKSWRGGSTATSKDAINSPT